eukprot:1444605-Rhodomonas_salina.1
MVLSAYAYATRSPVLTERMSNATSGTDIAYGATRPRYQESTDVAYAATRYSPVTSSRLWTDRCATLSSYAIILRYQPALALCGTDIGY